MNWQMRDGLPSNKITAAIQTHDGYVWAGTFEGLVRFDGVSFSRFDVARAPGMVDSTVTALFESPDGAIWIGHDSGSVTVSRQGQFRYFPVPTERRGTRIQNFAVDDAGDVWALDVAGRLFRVRDGLVLTPESGGSRGVFLMVSSRAGEVWLIARGKLSRFAHGALEVVALLPRMNGYVHGACPAADGGLWVIANGHLWKRTGENWSDDLGAVVTGDAPVLTMAEMRDGRLVGGTIGSGAFIIHPGSPGQGQSLRRSTGFPSDWITAAFQDDEGSLWLASGTSGLFRLGEEKIQMLLPPDGMGGRAALSVLAADDDDFWVGTEGGGVYRYQSGRWTHFAQDAGISNPYVWSVAQDLSHRIWIGTWGSGVQWLEGTHFVPRANAAEDTGVGALLASRRGGVLVGALQGVYWRSVDKTEWIEPSGTRRLRNVRAIAEDPDGSVWVGCYGEGLGLIKDGEVKQFTHRDGLSSDYVDCLHRDAAGALWIGTHGGGLNRLKAGRFSVVSSAHGLADNAIEHIEEDGLGFFWMSSKAGILRVAAADLNACADGALARVACVTYGLSDGLATLNCSGSLQPAGAKTPDGRLLFATDRGIALVNPREVKFNRVPPKVRIESARAGDATLFSGAMPDQPLRVAPGQSRIEVKYTALSFTGPEKIVFRRQLRPLEATPVYVGAERVAVYNYVPPGTYTFSVTAANSDGVWNEEGQSVKLVVLPQYWQTAWFKLAVAAFIISGTGALAWIGSRQRMQRRLERLQRERAIQAERTRIANDMHDDLGAHLTRITMLTETAQREAADPARLDHGLRQIYETARSVTRSMDEIVWAVNPKHDTFESLVAYFENFAVDFLRTAGVRCRLDMPLEFPAWTPSSEVRHNLFLCLKEALHNIVRHAGADMVTVSIRVDQGACTLVVSDNGRGPAAPGGSGAARDRIASGNGLESMRTRMERLGGRCENGEGAAGGWVVAFTVPIGTTVPADRLDGS